MKLTASALALSCLFSTFVAAIQNTTPVLCVVRAGEAQMVQILENENEEPVTICPDDFEQGFSIQCVAPFSESVEMSYGETSVTLSNPPFYIASRTNQLANAWTGYENVSEGTIECTTLDKARAKASVDVQFLCPTSTPAPL